MSDLTESEIFDRLCTSLRSAVDLCKKLAYVPAQGPNYRKLIEELDLIEGACRQVGAFRFDMRWNLIGFQAARFHQRIGDCIRHRSARTIFLAQAKMLEVFITTVERLRHARTGRRGPIIPLAKPTHRDTRPVFISRPSGLLVPSAAP